MGPRIHNTLRTQTVLSSRSRCAKIRYWVTLKKSTPAVANSRGAESETDPLPKIPIPEQSAKGICFHNKRWKIRAEKELIQRGEDSELQTLKQQCGNHASAEGTDEESSFSETPRSLASRSLASRSLASRSLASRSSDWIAAWISLR